MNKLVSVALLRLSASVFTTATSRLDDCGRSSQRSISSKIMAVRTIEIGSGAVDRRK